MSSGFSKIPAVSSEFVQVVNIIGEHQSATCSRLVDVQDMDVYYCAENERLMTVHLSLFARKWMGLDLALCHYV